MSGKSIKPRGAPLQPVEWPEQPEDKLQINIFGEIQAARNSQRFITVVHDMHSKWPEIQTSKDVTTETVITFLRTLFVRWGVPRQIITDNGPQFTSYRFQEFLKQHNIKHMRTSFYHPQGNGGVERFNQVLKHGLVTHLAEGTSVTEALQSFLFNYRAKNHALTGKSPAELMIRRRMREPLSMLNPSTAGEKLQSTSYQRIWNKIHLKQAKQKSVYR
ncbi:uncharacterized protein K02A2.6-like [Corticium candelabrum]|uniref:uncharacterized protein K02A2.6-like n=1 Tax=Corticium candelabrum TaxID=121492 RepID=UPI002E266E50|nr:uncharacterized protein K02A2.6-like [Corticium candelabrum]